MDVAKHEMVAQMEHHHEVDIDESFDRWRRVAKAIPDANEEE